MSTQHWRRRIKDIIRGRKRRRGIPSKIIVETLHPFTIRKQ